MNSGKKSSDVGDGRRWNGRKVDGWSEEDGRGKKKGRRSKRQICGLRVPKMRKRWGFCGLMGFCVDVSVEEGALHEVERKGHAFEGLDDDTALAEEGRSRLHVSVYGSESKRRRSTERNKRLSFGHPTEELMEALNKYHAESASEVRPKLVDTPTPGSTMETTSTEIMRIDSSELCPPATSEALEYTVPELVRKNSAELRSCEAPAPAPATINRTGLYGEWLSPDVGMGRFHAKHTLGALQKRMESKLADYMKGTEIKLKKDEATAEPTRTDMSSADNGDKFNSASEIRQELAEVEAEIEVLEMELAKLCESEESSKLILRESYADLVLTAAMRKFDAEHPLIFEIEDVSIVDGSMLDTPKKISIQEDISTETLGMKGEPSLMSKVDSVENREEVTNEALYETLEDTLPELGENNLANWSSRDVKVDSSELCPPALTEAFEDSLPLVRKNSDEWHSSDKPVKMNRTDFFENWLSSDNGDKNESAFKIAQEVAEIEAEMEISEMKFAKLGESDACMNEESSEFGAEHHLATEVENVTILDGIERNEPSQLWPKVDTPIPSSVQEETLSELALRKYNTELVVTVAMRNFDAESPLVSKMQDVSILDGIDLFDCGKNESSELWSNVYTPPYSSSPQDISMELEKKGGSSLTFKGDLIENEQEEFIDEALDETIEDTTGTELGKNNLTDWCSRDQPPTKNTSDCMNRMRREKDQETEDSSRTDIADYGADLESALGVAQVAAKTEEEIEDTIIVKGESRKNFDKVINELPEYHALMSTMREDLMEPTWEFDVSTSYGIKDGDGYGDESKSAGNVEEEIEMGSGFYSDNYIDEGESRRNFDLVLNELREYHGKSPLLSTMREAQMEYNLDGSLLCELDVCCDDVYAGEESNNAFSLVSTECFELCPEVDDTHSLTREGSAQDQLYGEIDMDQLEDQLQVREVVIETTTTESDEKVAPQMDFPYQDCMYEQERKFPEAAKAWQQGRTAALESPGQKSETEILEIKFAKSEIEKSDACMHEESSEFGAEQRLASEVKNVSTLNLPLFNFDGNESSQLLPKVDTPMPSSVQEKTLSELALRKYNTELVVTVAMRNFDAESPLVSKMQDVSILDGIDLFDCGKNESSELWPNVYTPPHSSSPQDISVELGKKGESNLTFKGDSIESKKEEFIDEALDETIEDTTGLEIWKNNLTDWCSRDEPQTKNTSDCMNRMGREKDQETEDSSRTNIDSADYDDYLESALSRECRKNFNKVIDELLEYHALMSTMREDLMEPTWEFDVSTSDGIKDGDGYGVELKSASNVDEEIEKDSEFYSDNYIDEGESRRNFDLVLNELREYHAKSPLLSTMREAQMEYNLDGSLLCESDVCCDDVYAGEGNSPTESDEKIAPQMDFPCQDCMYEQERKFPEAAKAWQQGRTTTLESPDLEQANVYQDAQEVDLRWWKEQYAITFPHEPGIKHLEILV